MRVELSIPQHFWDLLSAIGGIFYGDIKNQLVTGITTDSRDCIKGDVFFALDGNNFDGNDFIPDAIKKGAIPVGRGVKQFGIRVDSGNTALLSLASFYKNTLPNLIHTVAITGSVGKTTTKEFLKVLSGERYKTHATGENFNNDIGASLTVLSAPRDTEILILEFGMNHIGEIRKLSNSFSPDTAVITKIGSAHIGLLGNIQNIAKAKLEIISGLRGKLLLPLGESLLETEYPHKHYFSATVASANTSVLKNSFGQTELYLNRDLYSIFDFPSSAEHILECLAASIAASREIDIDPADITKGIEKISKNEFRHKVVTSQYGYTIIDDSYNASYESILAALKMLRDTPLVTRRFALLGDILELGDMSYAIHYAIGKAVANYKIDYLFMIGENAKTVYQGAVHNGFDKNRAFILNNLSFPAEVANFIMDILREGDTILIKASHKINLESIVKLIR